MEPTGSTYGEIVAIDFDGDRYCIDCAPAVLDGRSFSAQLRNDEWESYDDADGEDVVNRLLDGDIHTLSTGGVVLSSTESPDIDHWHCGRAHDCVNAVSGDEYDHIDHSDTVGVLLEL